MSLRIRILIALAVVITVALMTRMIKEKRVDLRNTLIWYILSIIVLLFDAFPSMLAALAGVLGIALPSNMIFLLAILLLIVIDFILTTTISELSSRSRKLAQEIALLKDEIEILNEQYHMETKSTDEGFGNSSNL